MYDSMSDRRLRMVRVRLTGVCVSSGLAGTFKGRATIRDRRMTRMPRWTLSAVRVRGGGRGVPNVREE